MGDYLKLFETDNERVEYENSENYIEPYVSYVEGDNSIYYNKPKFFCKLTLSDDSVVELEGSGELTQAMVSQYKDDLVSAEIGELCTSIGHGAFYGCSGLTNVTIPNGVTSIGNSAFDSCSGLTSITIPNTVTSIGGSAFTTCSSLSTITSHIMNAPSVNSGTFSGVKNGGTLYVPIGSSGYDTWMNDRGNLGYYNWTKVEQ